MDAKFEDVPDGLWVLVEPLLPEMGPYPKGGRPPVDSRKVFAGAVFKLRTGCQWKALPRQFGSGATVHRRFAAWTASGVFPQIWKAALRYYDDLKGLDWRWASMDSATVKAPKGGTRRARTPRIVQRAGPSGTS